MDKIAQVIAVSLCLHFAARVNNIIFRVHFVVMIRWIWYAVQARVYQ